jgi:peptide/nickel transport system substrate-binding protein
MRTRSLLTAISLAVTLAIVVSCAPATTEVQEVTKVVEKEVTKVVEKQVEVVATPTPVAKAGGDLVVVFPSEPTTIDPNVHANWQAGQVIRNVTDPLLVVDDDGNLHPGLAESWEQPDDLMSITFQLRQDVKFHDGTPFNAEALKFNFDRIMDPATESMGAADFMRPYDRTEIVDEYTVRIHWKTPYPFLNVAGWMRSYFPPNSPAAVEKWGEDYGTQALVGTGPYIFKEWVLGDHITVEKNPDYNWAPAIYDHPQPYPDSITFKFVEEAGTSAAILQTGEAHILLRLATQYVGLLGTDPNYVLLKDDMSGPGTMYVMSTTYPKTADLRVRQALEYAIDRDTIMRTVYSGLYTPQFGPLSKVTPCYDEASSSLYSYDPEKAKALLAEVGWRDEDDDGILEAHGVEGFEDGTLFNDFPIYSFDLMEGEALQAQMKAIGIDAQVLSARLPIRMEKARAGDYGLMVLAWRSPDPSILSTLWHSSQIGAWNFSMYVDPEMDAWLDEAVALADMGERCELYNKVQRRMMEQALEIPIYTAAQIVAMRSEIQGVKGDSTKVLGIDYFDIYIEK